MALSYSWPLENHIPNTLVAVDADVQGDANIDRIRLARQGWGHRRHHHGYGGYPGGSFGGGGYGGYPGGGYGGYPGGGYPGGGYGGYPGGGISQSSANAQSSSIGYGGYPGAGGLSSSLSNAQSSSIGYGGYPGGGGAASSASAGASGSAFGK